MFPRTLHESVALWRRAQLEDKACSHIYYGDWLHQHLQWPNGRRPGRNMKIVEVIWVAGELATEHVNLKMSFCFSKLMVNSGTPPWAIRFNCGFYICLVSVTLFELFCSTVDSESPQWILRIHRELSKAVPCALTELCITRDNNRRKLATYWRPCALKVISGCKANRRSGFNRGPEPGMQHPMEQQHICCSNISVDIRRGGGETRTWSRI